MPEAGRSLNTAAALQVRKLACAQHLFSQGFATDTGTLQLLMDLENSNRRSSKLAPAGRNASVFEVAASTPGTGISRSQRVKSSKRLDDYMPAVKRLTELGTVNSCLLAPASSSSGSDGQGAALALAASFAIPHARRRFVRLGHRQGAAMIAARKLACR